MRTTSSSESSVGARQPAPRTRTRAVAAILAVIFLLTLVPAGAAPQKADPRKQREEVRRKKAEVAAQIDSLKASVEELSEALAVLDANLRQEEAALQHAQAEVDRATAEAQEIQQRRAETEAALREEEARMREVAIEAYSKPSEDNLLNLQSSDLNEAVRKQALLDIVGNATLDITERIKGLKAELEALEEERLAALARAEEAKAEVQARYDAVKQAEAEQQEALDALERRHEHLLYERQHLDAKEKELNAEIERQRREAEAALARARRKSGGGSGRTVTLPSSGEMVNVGGIVVHRSIADNVRALLDAAAADGIVLGGGGYRDPSAQIALRRAHCGSSDYDIWQKPASACRPPTARPGSSNHERGLAIDFTYQGRTLTRSSPAFHWLQRNAARFGLYNLPSEPWHWSVDGG